ncbi:NAD(P)-dependent alcohol dehydrogenase [Streptosporangium sp. 'caverna']|uniref:zinc-dependent alcohol dehydrogenase family protein n=1 Tax=Streptosporangium sp. 'caverna' TaxID=2202249 RepID=UPI000D7DE681|nr:NAD(P)-dependent alcohol dehydrogenase [Streptosporangium sp. 'caverna']AWS42915.1 NAD(P)-dependent alcohol dehydrogenase [Streptosporangium sp. 'caverna']
MRAYQLDRFESLDGLVLRDREMPQPGPGEAVVRIHARSLNYRDLLIMHRRYPVPGTAGVVPVSDGAGEVVAVGEGVTRVAVGDRVAATYFPRWRDGRFAVEMAAEQFGCTRDGMLAEFAVADQEALVTIPAHLSYEEASTLPCAGVMAWSALTGLRPVLPSETVLTIGSGGVALFALQFATLFGARVIAVTSSESKAELLKRHGASVVVNSSRSPDWERAVRDATDGRGVDHVVETGGLDTLPRSLASCGADAHLALVAALGAGTLDAPALGAPATIRRLYVGSRASFEAMNRAIAHHTLRPVIGSVFPFDEAKDAYTHFAAKQHVGKVVIGT